MFIMPSFNHNRILSIIYIILAASILVFGIYFRVVDLGKINFQNDEFFHVETAKGYLETGKYLQWDYLTDTSKDTYTRAWPYTWLVAQSFKFFGISEWSGRLPSAISGILLLPLLFWLAWKVSKNWLVALFVLSLASFDQSLIWSSRICRMYAVFFVLYILAVILIYYYLEHENKKYRLLYLISGGGAFILAYLFHELALLFLPCLLIYFILHSLYLWFGKKVQHWNGYYIITLIFFSGVIIAGLVHFFIHPLVIDNYIVLRATPNWEYFIYPFSGLKIWFWGWIVMFLGICLWEGWHKFKAYLICLSVPVIIFFVFFAGRYAAKKYILFIIPLLFIIYADSLVQGIKKFIQNKNSANFIIALFFLFLGVFAVNINNSEQKHDFSQGYTYIEANYSSGQPILIQGAQTYYFSHPSLNLISLGVNKEFTLKQLKYYLQKYPQAWVVWPKYKSYHLKGELIDYCKKNLEYQEEISKSSNLQIYFWNK